MFSGNPPMSVETTLHYSWVYAQVHFPHHAQQVHCITNRLQNTKEM